ncbi:hypothetical protein [Sorangium sp. So ce388]|uniref:hypothetical protein n=1 Tax=Sorangium sp. So ce388 TaxID=3133309 RepID=UPI003F5CAA1C
MNAAALSTYEAAALAAVKLNASMPGGNVAFVETRRRDLIASLGRVRATGETSLTLASWIRALGDDGLWMVSVAVGVPSLPRIIGALRNKSGAALTGHAALEGAALAAVCLDAAMAAGASGPVVERRRELVDALDRLHQAGVASVRLTDWLAALRDERIWSIEFRAGSLSLLRTLGELLNLDEAVAAPASESRPETPPPPSGDGDEESLEHAAARDSRDTLPPASGHRELAEMACVGADTLPPDADGDLWDGETTIVPV